MHKRIYLSDFIEAFNDHGRDDALEALDSMLDGI